MGYLTSSLIELLPRSRCGDIDRQRIIPIGRQKEMILDRRTKKKNRHAKDWNSFNDMNLRTPRAVEVLQELFASDATIPIGVQPCGGGVKEQWVVKRIKRRNGSAGMLSNSGGRQASRKELMVEKVSGVKCRRNRCYGKTICLGMVATMQPGGNEIIYPGYKTL